MLLSLQQLLYYRNFINKKINQRMNKVNQLHQHVSLVIHCIFIQVKKAGFLLLLQFIAVIQASE